MATANPVAAQFEHIFVPMDFSDVSLCALKYAVALAGTTHAELLLVPIEPLQNTAMLREASWGANLRFYSVRPTQIGPGISDLVEQIRKIEPLPLARLLRDELPDAIKQHEVDLVVLGSHGKKAVEHLFFGSNFETTLRTAHVPVLSIGPRVPEPPGMVWAIHEVLCATTFDSRSAETDALAHRVAAQHEAELVFLDIRSGSHNDVDWASFEDSFRMYIPEELGHFSWLRRRVASAAPGKSIVNVADQRGSSLVVFDVNLADGGGARCGASNLVKLLMEAPCPVMTFLGKWMK
jgi:nucleotide-binding universal stress UspA family protein